MRVLVVDDEVRLADGVRRGPEAEGWAVDVAHDGVDGLWDPSGTKHSIRLDAGSGDVVTDRVDADD